MTRLICFAIGYCFGCFLSAAAVVRAGKKGSVFQIGTGNPGMANVMAQCGIGPGILVLLGDVGKVVIACGISILLFQEQLPRELLFAYTGLGAITGHDFPFWHRFKGGKGVSCTCAALFCIHPLFGLAAMAAGLIVCIATKNLAIGAIVIPLVFLPAAYFVFGTEMLVLCFVIAGLSLLRNLRGMKRTEKKG